MPEQATKPLPDSRLIEVEEDLEQTLEAMFPDNGKDKSAADKAPAAGDTEAETIPAEKVTPEELEQKALAARKPKPAQAAAPPDKPPVAAGKPTLASLQDLLRQQPDRESFQIEGVTVSRKELQDFVADANWIDRNRRRAEELNKTRARYGKDLEPIFDKAAKNPNVAGMLKRAIDLYENPNLIQQSTARRPAPVAEETLDEFAPEQPPVRDPEVAELKARLDALEKSKDSEKHEVFMSRKQDETDRICQAALSKATGDGLPWTAEIEERFIAKLVALAGPELNWTDETCEEAFELATRKERGARTAAQAASQAAAAARSTRPAPPPAISSGRVPAQKVSAEQLATLTTGRFGRVLERLKLKPEDILE